MAGRHGHDGLGEKRHSTRAHPRSESNALSLSKGFFNRPKVLVFSGRGHATFHVSMLQCADDSYYVGLTEDLESRIQRHNAGTASRWTACRLPVALVYCEQFDHLEDAAAREAQLKGWSRAKKKASISANSESLKQLSRCRSLHYDSQVLPVHNPHKPLNSNA
jgi:putative endonuclease